VPESCKAEKRLLQALLNAALKQVEPAQLKAFKDDAARENCAFFGLGHERAGFAQAQTSKLAAQFAFGWRGLKQRAIRL
jgi:hypothetical protein